MKDCSTVHPARKNRTQLRKGSADVILESCQKDAIRVCRSVVKLSEPSIHRTVQYVVASHEGRQAGVHALTKPSLKDCSSYRVLFGLALIEGFQL